MKIKDRFREPDNTETVRMCIMKRNGESFTEEHRILCEHELTIIINEREAIRLVCTASDIVNLVVGRLLSEGFVESAKDIESIYICETGQRARVFFSEEAAARLDKENSGMDGRNHYVYKDNNDSNAPDDYGRMVVSQEIQTCCADNINLMKISRPLKKIAPHREVRPEEIFELTDRFKKDGELHRETGGTQSAYLMYAGRTVYGCEDIGRHNALDKAIGEMTVKGYDPSECLIFTTGRTPVDMVRKGIRAGVAGLVSKSVPTEQAAELAREYGLNLYFRAWPDSYVSI